MTTEDKFKAAVNVIRNLPPKGSVKPSYHVMLKFYAYFKQATEGPNKSSKPPFWDPVKKAKWDAWSKLGNMDHETAMKLYVEEFKKIVDSFSSTNVGDIDKSEIDSFYASVPVKDLELLVGPVMTHSRTSSLNVELNKEFIEETSVVSPLLKRSSAVCRANKNKLIRISTKKEVNCEKHLSSSELDIPYDSLKKPTKPSEVSLNVDGTNFQREILGTNEYVCSNGSVRSDEEEDEEFFLDTIESSDNESTKHRLIVDENVNTTNLPYVYMNGQAVQVSNYTNKNNNSRLFVEDRETNLHLSKVIIHLQKDLEKVVRSVNAIEQRIGQLRGKIVERHSTLPHFVASPLISFILLFSWPVVLQLLIIWFRRKQ